MIDAAPLISETVPVYNTEALLREAVESVQRCKRDFTHANAEAML